MSSSSSKSMSSSSEDDNELRRGPWTLEEDTMLTQYIAKHREGRWNLLAKRSGLRRTGKSCRLRWLNYLKPDVKRGNLTPQEQLLILELHFKWGNRWSKIARHLPGRTDNEIKNYWRTRVQKKARHLKIDADSREFKQLLGRFWVPRLLQKARDSWSSSAMSVENQPAPLLLDTVSDQYSATGTTPPQIPILTFSDQHQHNLELDQNMCSSESANAPILPQFLGSIATPFPAPDNTDTSTYVYDGYSVNPDMESFNLEAAMTAVQDMEYHVGDCQVAQSNWVNNEFSCNMSNMDELWQFRNLQS